MTPQHIASMDFSSLSDKSFPGELRTFALQLVEALLHPKTPLVGYLRDHQQDLFRNARIWSFEKVANRSCARSIEATSFKVWKSKAHPKMKPFKGQLRKVLKMQPGSRRDELILRPVSDIFHGEHAHLWPPVLLPLAGEWAWRDMAFQKTIAQTVWQFIITNCLCGPGDVETPILRP